MTVVSIVTVFLYINIICCLIKYDRSTDAKRKIIEWISRTLFRTETGIDQSAATLLQVVVGFVFVFSVGIALLF